MKICLCGSTRFMDQYVLANRRLTLMGHIVYSVAAVSTGDHSELTMDEKIVLDAVHLAKIEESEAIMVVGQQEDGSIYIGDSTRREIMFAELRDKKVYFFDPNQPLGGPTEAFRTSIEAAYETTATRQARIEQERARQREFSAIFGGVHGGAVGEDEVDHSDDPEASKQDEETN